MAGNLQFVGDPNLTFGPIEIDYGPKGNTSHFTVTSPSVAALENYYNYIVQFGAQGRFSGLDVGNDGQTGAMNRELTVSLPGLINNLGTVIAELFFDQWELLSNEDSDTIFDNPRIVGSNAPNAVGNPFLNYNDKVVLSDLTLNGGTIIEALARLNANLKSITAPQTPGSIIPPTINAPGNYFGDAFGGGVANADTTPGAPPVIFQDVGINASRDTYGGTAPQQLAIEILKGQTEYERPTQVLRHTSYKSAGSTYASNRSGEMCIYSTAQLLSEVGSGWTYNLPADLFSQISSLPVQWAALHEQPYYQWGWLKKINRQPVLANFMVEVSVEYELALWSNLRYSLR